MLVISSAAATSDFRANFPVSQWVMSAMPLGVLFQSAVMLSWSSTLLSGAWPQRTVGVFGSACAVFLLIVLLVAAPKLTTHLLMMAIGVQAIWYPGLAALLARRTIGD